MAFKKREKSKAVDAAQTRLAAMKEIDSVQGEVVNYGTTKAPCSSATIGAQCQQIEADIEKYNGLLAQADQLANDIERKETGLNDAVARVLLGAQAQFGRDSDEVEQLGGTRQSERAKPKARAKDTPK